MINLNQYREFYYVYSLETNELKQLRFDGYHARSVDTELRNDAIAKGIPYSKALYLVNLWNKQGWQDTGTIEAQRKYIYTID